MTGRAFAGLRTTAILRRECASMSSDSARSKIAATSPLGIACRRRSCATFSLSRVAALAVKRIS